MAVTATQDPVHDQTYQRYGVLWREGQLVIDLAETRSIRILGITATGQQKDYLLRVSDSGKLSLV